MARGMVPWFQRFIFIIFIAKGRGRINLWNQGRGMAERAKSQVGVREKKNLGYRQILIFLILTEIA
jgi:hypothetical protein